MCGSGPSTKSDCSIPYNPVPLRGEYGFKTPEGGLSHNIWADKLGVPIAAHAIGREGIRNCLRAGVDTIEHGQQLALDLTDELAAYGGSLIPTLVVYRQIAEKSELPEYARAKARALLPEHEGAVEAARTVGVLIGAGSDAGSPLTPTAP